MEINKLAFLFVLGNSKKYRIMADDKIVKVAPDTADWYAGVMGNAQEVVIKYFDTLGAMEGDRQAGYLLGLLASLQTVREYFNTMAEE